MTTTNEIDKVHRNNYRDMMGDPYAEGYDAAVARKTKASNPYCRDDKDEHHQMWNRGFKDYNNGII